MLEHFSIVISALYLRGLPRQVSILRRRWVKVVSTLRNADCSLSETSSALRSAGFWEEALCLEDTDLLKRAQGLFEGGRVLTAVDSRYPKRWMERLRESSPPALWLYGSMPDLPLLGIVGSRHVDSSTRNFASEVGKQAVQLGFAIVSGGAMGCDQAGAAGALAAGGSVVEVLPHGINGYSEAGKCALSACAPDEMFSTPSAMERNSLIYAASEQTVVVHSRFKEGGTWIGAGEATRRGLCPLIIRDDGSPASSALIGLGGVGICSPSQLGDALAHPPAQRGLFGIG